MLVNSDDVPDSGSAAPRAHGAAARRQRNRDDPRSKSNIEGHEVAAAIMARHEKGRHPGSYGQPSSPNKADKALPNASAPGKTPMHL